MCDAMRKYDRDIAATCMRLSSALKALQVHSWTADQAFRPRLTAKGRLRRAHTIAELHDGGKNRRERALVCRLQTEESAGRGLCMTVSLTLSLNGVLLAPCSSKGWCEIP